MIVEWFEITSRVFNKPLILAKENGTWILRTDFQQGSDADIAAQGNSINEVISNFTQTVNGQLALDLEEIRNETFE